FLHIHPKAVDVTSGNIPSTLGVYPIWLELLSIHDSLESLTKDELYSILRFYNETYLEIIWQLVYNLSIDQTIQNEILDSQIEFFEFLNIQTKKEPTAPPNSLWFGVLDLAQCLSQKINTTCQFSSLLLFRLGIITKI
ncbi:10132_t:CDS:2, partial [Cetraspora pellucida]